jgi:hypothetical protein
MRATTFIDTKRQITSVRLGDVLSRSFIHSRFDVTAAGGDNESVTVTVG